MHKPFRSGVLVCAIPLDLLDISHGDFQSQVFWGSLLWCRSQRLGVPDVGLKTFSLQGYTIFVKFLSLGGHHAEGGFWQDHISVSPICLNVAFLSSVM